MRLCTLIKQTMAEAGMPRPDGYSEAELRGLINANVYGNTGFSVAHRTKEENPNLSAECLDFNVVVSGDEIPQI